MGRTSSWAVLGCALLGAASALEVTMPEEGDVLMAGRTQLVEWEGTGDSRFEIDLYYCDDSCTGDDCGEWVTNLCPFGEMGCPDSAGDYDVVMPEPLLDYGSGYKIRVVDINDEDSNDCSGEFTLLSTSYNSSMEEVEMDGPYLMVTSPTEGDVAMVCMEYTLEWEYDDGVGNSAGRFDLDLYEADGSGDCGTFVTSICDKEAIGCKDTQGDYDVTIPCDISSGQYRIRVGVFDDDDVFDCSDVFSIFGDDDTMTTTDDDGSFSFVFRFI